MRRRLGKFVGLQPDERSLFLRTALLLLGTRLALTVLPFARVERVAGRLMAARDMTEDSVPRERLAWGVQVAGRYIPGARCLAQAIVLKGLMRQHGYPARIEMGFGKDDDDNFKGHAWVESQGQVWLGDRRSRHNLASEW